MSKGYTGCIDIERLNGSVETLASIESYLNNTDLNSNFIEIETYLKNLNFEHGNFNTTYKESIETITEKLEEIKKDINTLTTSLEITVKDFSDVDDISKEDVKKLSGLYGNTTSRLNINELVEKDINIKLTDNATIFKDNIDDSIKGYMVKNNLTDYPTDYNSLEEWKISLEQKYNTLNISEEEKADLVDREMSVWRQEQTASPVTNLASSGYAERQVNVSDYTENYISKYGLSKNDATNLANLKEDVNILKANNASQDIVDTATSKLNELENQLGVNLRKINPKDLATDINGMYEDTAYQEPTVTHIPAPTPEMPVEDSSSTTINTVPIGLGIAAAGISGSIGAVLVDEYADTGVKPKKFNKFEELEEYEDDTEIKTGAIYEPDNMDDSDYYDREIADVGPYHANKDYNSKKIFYNEYDEDLPTREDDD